MHRTWIALGAAALTVTATAGTASGGGGPLPPPRPPQLSQLPGAGVAPDLSGSPLGREVPGLLTAEPPVRDPAVGGSFSEPFAEPGPSCRYETEGDRVDPATATAPCKPAGVSVVELADGRVLYWDGLEAEENMRYSEAVELSDTTVNDQSRLLTIDGAQPSRSRWVRPSPVDGGVDGRADRQYLVPNAPGPLKEVLNDPGTAPGSLFCSFQVTLADGDVLVPGGSDYWGEPHVPGTHLGVDELQGLRETRVFHPATQTWTQAGKMNYGRWYPTMVTLGDGKVFVAGGVLKLIKPVYPQDVQDSGTNVRPTETFDPRTGRWTDNGPSAARTFPLYPRLHLLPDGHVFYDPGGQAFSPFGEGYDEALWNFAAVYDPAARDWRNVGVPLGVSIDAASGRASAFAGFRGSAFDVMLPLTPPYRTASFLAGGGVPRTTPGGYFATNSATIDTVDTARGDAFTSTPVAPLNNTRWFSSAVLLPTGQVAVFSGANRDEVVGPGTGFAVTQAEMYDPATGRWTRLASAHDVRTYHNTAILLPSGQVLVGGHAPHATLYGYNQTLPGGFTNDFRDPSFELYDPPYLHGGVQRPLIEGVSSDSLGYGATFTISTPQGERVSKVMLIRNASLTHLIDGDGRGVVLPVVSRTADTVTVQAPPDGDVAPPGPYLLFVDTASARGLVPSVARQVFVGAPMPAWAVAGAAWAATRAAAGTPATPARRTPGGAGVLASQSLPRTGGLPLATLGILLLSVPLAWLRYGLRRRYR